MELVRTVVNFEITSGGIPVAGNVERTFSATDAMGTYQRTSRDVLTATELNALIPEKAELVLTVEALRKSVAELTASLDAAAKERDAQAAELAAMREAAQPAEVTE